MKNAQWIIAFGLTTAVLGAAPAAAQPPLHYDPYYALPRLVHAAQTTAGLQGSDMTDVGNTSTVFVAPKYGINDYLEIGARVDLGLLYEGRDDFSSLVVGGKYRLNAQSAATFGLLAPYGAVDKPGVAVGFMTSLNAGEVTVENHLQLGMLDGYSADKNAAVVVLVRPSANLGDNVIGHLDIVGTTDTEDISGRLGIDLIANADLSLGGVAIVNVGLSRGVAGDFRQRDLGLKVGLTLRSL